ncbi:MAG TPA: DUF6580 family putative transport protein [Pirellulales bacterium]|nr:DUF6580 family putative transport protein [Pirellulales bacterium]
MIHARFYTLLSITLAAALARLVPHWWNFTPIGALALFGGAYFMRRGAAFAVPLGAMLLSDVILGITRYGSIVLYSQPVVYGCFVATVLIGMLLRNRRTVVTVPAAAIASAVLFFVVTNFAVWYGGERYPQRAEGLVACYVAGLPFFRNGLLGDLFYSAILFGGFELAQRRWPALRLVGGRLSEGAAAI